MRPILLKMTAFGPYPEETSLDFTLLKDKNIFVITGPTGSGKTTIFDAICYALYGETSGNQRSGKDLRSDFVDIDGVKTEVELTFSVKGKDYYIKRAPAQERRKKKGEGTVEVPAAVEFKELNSSKAPLTKADQVGEAVENIIGIKADQFRKIVMIPQGDFREFLSANTTVKEEILRKIFGSEFYKRFQEKLVFRAQNLYKDVAEHKTKIRENIQLLDIATNAELVEKIAKDAPTGEIIELLYDFMGQEELRKAEAENEKKALNEKIQKETEEFGKQQEINKKFEEKEKCEATLSGLEKRKSEMAEKEVRRQRAEKAQNLLPYENSMNERLKERNSFQSQLQNEKNNLQHAETVLAQAEAERKKAEDLEKPMEEQSRQIVVLNGYVKDVQALEEKRRAIAALQLQHETLNKQIADNKKKIDMQEAELENLQRKEKVRADLKLQLEKLKTSYSDIENSHSVCQGLYKECRQYTLNLGDMQEKKELKEKLEKEIESDRERYEARRNIFNSSSAILLAKSLTEGDACPVCGSTHHPAPNRIEGDLPTEKEINELDDAIRKKQTNLSEFGTQIGTLEGKQSILKTSIDHKQEELKAKGWFSGFSDEVDWLDYDGFIKPVGIKMQEEKAALSKKLQETTNQVAILDMELKDLEAGKSELKKRKARLDIDNNTFLTVSTSLSKEDEGLKGIFDRVPAEYREPDKLKKDISDCKSKLDTMTEYVKSATDRYNAAKTGFEKLKERVEGLTANLGQSEAALAKAKAEFDANMSSVFENMASYNEAKLGREQIKSLEEELNQYRDALNITLNRVKKLSEELNGCVKTDRKAMELIIAEHKKELDEKAGLVSKIEGRLSRNRDVLKFIENNHERIQQKEARYRIVGALARMANGNAEEKVSFETYVLASYFEDVILEANKRLQKMTSGRYYLMRKEEGKGGGRKGLGLDIYDNYTGKTRSVDTLSGGESFKASLALALGLSDEVQRNSGGVELNTMFIDEGFGTLDSESLDYAINILMELQQNGRMVAVISHVNELKEKIPAKLLVEASLSGSKARFSGVS